MAVFRRWRQIGACLAYEIKVAPTEDTEVDHVVLIMTDDIDNDNGTDEVIDDASSEEEVSRLATYENMVSYAVSTEDERPKSLSIVLACPDPPSKESTYHVECLRLICKVEPDVILFSGYRVAKAMYGSAWQKRYAFMKTSKFEATTRHDKVFKYECMATVTIPMWGMVQPFPSMKGDDGGGFINLIGQFISHLQAAIRGQNRYQIDIPHPQDLVIQTIDTMDKFDDFYQELLEVATPVFDTETANLNRKANNKILTMQWLLPTETGWYNIYFIPFDHKESEWLPEERAEIKKKMRRYFENAESTYIIGAGLKFDVIQIMNQLGVRWLNHRIYDIQSGEFIFDENIKFLTKFVGKPYALDSVERRYGYDRPNDVLDKEDRSDMSNQSLEAICEYGSLDVVSPWAIHQVQLAEAKRRGYKMFKRLVADQLGNTIHAFASMESRGMLADAAHLQRMTMPDSEVNSAILALQNRFRESDAANRINESMLKEKGFQSEGLFGSNEKPWLFDISKQDIQQQLFFDELRLEPLRHGKKGEGSTDKAFQAQYIHVPEVSWFQDLSKLLTIKQNFIDTLYERLIKEPDALNDGRIRPTFDYRYVLTGRTSARDPNSQNQPSRGKLAKIVKKIWRAATGKVLLKPDFNAHEVRGFGTASADPVISKVFAIADEARVKLRLASVEELAEVFQYYKKFGDVHIQNVKFFFGQEVTKDHPLRYAIKAVVFGVIYGKGAKSLGIELRGEAKKRVQNIEKDIKAIEAEISKRKHEKVAA